MKSFVSSIAALSIALFVVGCGGAPAPDAGTDTGSTTTDMMHSEAPDPAQAAAEGEEGAAAAEGEGAAPAEGEAAAPAEGEAAAPAEGEAAAE
jgi:hypothetical protein